MRPNAGQAADTAASAASSAGASAGASARAVPDTGSPARDDFGDPVVIGATAPERIISLNPATTEMLYAMGAGPRVVGRTRWDDYPPAVRGIPSVGDGLRPNVEAVLALHPDLVLLYASSGDRDAAQRFRSAGVATLSVRVDRIADFRRTLRLLGLVLRNEGRAAAVADSVAGTLARVRQATAGSPRVSAVWEVDLAPIRVIGGGSYLNELLTDAGARNLYEDTPDPSPQVSLEDLLARKPDVVLASPGSARELRADPRWQAWLSVPQHRLLIPDTALVGMPAVRMGEAAVALATLLHPELRPALGIGVRTGVRDTLGATHAGAQR